MIKTLEWTDAGVRFIDQTRLPTEEIYVTCGNYAAVATAIRDMIVRGAPAIGVAAAMGIALGVAHSEATTYDELRLEFAEICRTLAATRPTAVNLFWAVERVAPGSRQELRLLGGVEPLELRNGAPEPDLAPRGVDKVKRNKPSEPLAALRFHDEMGDRTSDRVDDHAADLAADPVGTAGVGPDRERRRVCHGHPPRLLGP